MFKNISLRTIILAVSGLIGFAGVCLVVLVAFTIQSIQEIEEDWYTYQSDRSEKVRLESSLRASIGYGGMIHDFKDYVLRHEDFRMARVQADIGAARAVIGQYRSLTLSQAETVALEDISDILGQYSDALLATRDMIVQGATTAEIDQQVRVDDSTALRSLKTLRSEVISLSTSGKVLHPVKGRIVANLRAGMGYGGMIHDFKNLVLRGDTSWISIISEDIAEIEESIATYRSLETTTAENVALDDIESTIIAYKLKLDTILDLIVDKADIAEVDKAALIDDSAALRGLRTLDKEIAYQVDSLAKNVGNELTFLATVVPAVNWGVLGAIIIAMGGSIWFFQVHVIRPISTLTSLMNLVASDETRISIQGTRRTNEIGQMARALETFRENIISRKAAEAEILSMALTDPLTGLGNRKRFDQRLQEAIVMARRTDSSIACMMIDLDKFKPVNDTYGHAAGDEVLKIVSDRLTLISRDTDFVARLGGDEFALIATVIEDPSNAELPAKRIIDQLRLPIYYDEHDIRIGGSIGISIFPENADNADDLVKQADKALYAAKDAGRDTFRFAQAETPPEEKVINMGRSH